MAKKIPEPTERPRERAFLVGIEIRDQENLLSLEDSLAELGLLAETAGLDVVGQATQRLDHPNPQTFIGPGKVEEVYALAEEVQAEVILFDEELSPRHLRELEKVFGDHARILDRTALILDIFAQHAATREGSLQVELAQYEYRLPRLTRAWTHLARQAGGGGGRAGGVGGVGLRGPGETQLEVDRRDIHRRISTLLNRLSEANVYVADQLFATLDPTTRRVGLPGGNLILATDTVGFIQKLPTELIAAFRATLEEIVEADLLLHVVDVTHANAQAQAEAVYQTLAEIEADHIPALTVLNKIDLLPDPERARQALALFPKSVAISALTGEGITDLLGLINDHLYETYTHVLVRLPYQEGGLIAAFHDQGQVERVEQTHQGVLIQGRLPGRLLARYQPFLVQRAG
jgi:GTP-binding protein HflX